MHEKITSLTLKLLQKILFTKHLKENGLKVFNVTITDPKNEGGIIMQFYSQMEVPLLFAC